MQIEREMTHRKKQKGKDSYNPYAGPYDITLVKLNKFVHFEEGKVRQNELMIRKNYMRSTKNNSADSSHLPVRGGLQEL